MQVIIIDPLLRNQSGHKFSYTLSLCAELEKRGINSVILGNILADENCRKIKNFYPCLNDISSELFRMPGNIFQIHRLIKGLTARLDNFLFQQSGLLKQKGNMFFLHSLYIFELLSLGCFLKKRTKVFIDNHHKFLIGLNFTYKRRFFPATLFFSFLYKNVFATLIKELRSQIIYFCDGEPLRKNYAELLRSTVHILPLPLNSPFFKPYIQPLRQTSLNKIVVSYVGGARYNKGFDILVKMLSSFFAEGKNIQNISFLIQVDVQRQQLRKDRRIVLEAIEQLQGLSHKFNNIRLVYGALPIEEYYGLFSESDIVVLPYREDFWNIPSSIFRETIISGKVPIVSSHTSMAVELKEYNLGDLIFNLKDKRSFAFVLRKVADNLRDYQIKIEKIQQDWLGFYSSAHLVDRITDLVS